MNLIKKTKEMIEEQRKLVSGNLSGIITSLQQYITFHEDDYDNLFKSYSVNVVQTIVGQYTDRGGYGQLKKKRKLLESSMSNNVKKHNPNNPEYYANCCNDMDLVELLIMLANWKTERKVFKYYVDEDLPADLVEFIKASRCRYRMSNQLTEILINTAERYFYKMRFIVSLPGRKDTVIAFDTMPELKKAIKDNEPEDGSTYGYNTLPYGYIKKALSKLEVSRKNVDNYHELSGAEYKFENGVIVKFKTNNSHAVQLSL